MNDLVERVAKQIAFHGRHRHDVSKDAEDFWVNTGTESQDVALIQARAVVALVLLEVAKKVKDHAKILPKYKCPDDECADPTEQGYGNACHNIEHMLRALGVQS